MSKKSAPIKMAVDGYEVSLSFADSSDPAALGQAKQILLSSFINRVPGPKASGILVVPPGQRYNNGEGESPMHLENSITPTA